VQNFKRKINLLKNLFSKTTFKLVLKEIFESGTIDDEVIGIIQKRLYNIGVDAENKKLSTDYSGDLSEFYANSTFKIKKDIGQKYDNVTLHDSGTFYESFEGLTNNNGFDIVADFDKENGHIRNNFTLLYSSNEDFEQKILDMTVEEKAEYVKTELLPEFLNYLRFDFNKIK